MRVQPEIGFPEHVSALERLRQQMHLLAASFRGSAGQILRALLSEALTDAEFQVAIRDDWIAPRRAAATVIIEKDYSRIPRLFSVLFHVRSRRAHHGLRF